MSAATRLHGIRTLVVAIAFVGSGCARSGDQALIVATNWPIQQCERLERAIAEGSRPSMIRWIRVGPDEDPTLAADRGDHVDMVLGGPPESHARLAARGQLAPLFPIDERPWRIVSGSEAVSVIAGTPRADAARSLIASIGEAGPAPPASSFGRELRAAIEIDARPELLAAKVALAQNGSPPRQVGWMNEPPPWPPASITRMRSKPDGRELIAVLASQVAPDPIARAWLIEAFDRVPKPIDDALLLELDQAGEGRLASDSRFRVWLRTEWATWARQRYRRVVRNLTERGGPPR